jgi:hypothetical protein
LEGYKYQLFTIIQVYVDYQVADKNKRELAGIVEKVTTLLWCTEAWS